MSLLRRKRIQNRILQQNIPATRDARTSLDVFRGLRNVPGLRLFGNRQEKRPEARELSLEMLSSIKRQESFSAYHKRSAEDYDPKKAVFKPLTTIKLNGQLRTDLPSEHPICQKRFERRQVLFAKQKAGVSGQRPRRQNNDIKLRCK